MEEVTYVRLYEVMSTQELTMIKIVLNREEVDYRILFENTLQLAEVYALGNSGAIIEVAEYELRNAITILEELGIQINYESSEDQFRLVSFFDRQTKKLPLLGKIDLSYRFLLLISSVLVTVFSLILIDTIEITAEELVSKSWCIDEIIYNGQKLEKPKPKPGEITLNFESFFLCERTLSFTNPKKIMISGLYMSSITGYYEIERRKRIVIRSHSTDSNNLRLDGSYDLKINWQGITTMTSPRVTIRISER
ncbi:MAG: hypothetical protein AAF806_28900 [Bacteroidota bacterium]